MTDRGPHVSGEVLAERGGTDVGRCERTKALSAFLVNICVVFDPAAELLLVVNQGATLCMAVYLGGQELER